MEKIKRIIKTLFEIKIIRFFLVAGLNTIFGYGVFAFFLFIGLHYAIAGLIATILGILFNFKTYGIIVFKNKSNRLLFRFLLVYLINYFIAVSFIWAFSLIDINNYIASAIITIPNALISYLLNKKIVFKHLTE